MLSWRPCPSPATAALTQQELAPGTKTVPCPRHRLALSSPGSYDGAKPHFLRTISLFSNTWRCQSAALPPAHIAVLPRLQAGLENCGGDAPKKGCTSRLATLFLPKKMISNPICFALLSSPGPEERYEIPAARDPAGSWWGDSCIDKGLSHAATRI